MFFFPSVIRAVEEEAYKRGYNLMVLHSNDSLAREIENVEVCARMGVDGIMISLSKQSTNLNHFKEISADKPIVYFDKIVPVARLHQVITPGKKATQLAVKKLIEKSAT